MSSPVTGVFPCYKNQFKIDKTGGDGSTANNLVPIAQMENFSVSIDGNVEEWKPWEYNGWTDRMVTGKSMTISISGKRQVGDPGNDYINGVALKTGSEANSTLVWTFPDAGVLKIRGVISVTEWASGESTAVAPLAFDFMSKGIPEFTEPVTEPA